MKKFPYWIAQNKDKIIVYDAEFEIVYEDEYSKDKEVWIKNLVLLNNKRKISSF